MMQKLVAVVLVSVSQGRLLGGGTGYLGLKTCDNMKIGAYAKAFTHCASLPHGPFKDHGAEGEPEPHRIWCREWVHCENVPGAARHEAVQRKLGPLYPNVNLRDWRQVTTKNGVTQEHQELLNRMWVDANRMCLCLFSWNTRLCSSSKLMYQTYVQHGFFRADNVHLRKWR